MNSGNLPPDLLESTLFGHVKGAFTGAVNPKKGLCDMADKGSIFFDEIGNISPETQAKLLRVMQEREFMRLGGMETIKVDVRIVAATNCDLRQMVEDGRFREDLYYRLHVINVYLPPLRERKEDIPLLAQHFLEKYSKENNRPALELSPEALDLMMEYDWPGNVRELENVMERAVVLGSGHRIGPDLIPEHVRSSPQFHIPRFVVPPEGISFKDVITDVEKRLIESTLEAAGGVQKKAAELLRIKPTTLNEMIKRHDIGRRRRKSGDADDDARASRTRALSGAEMFAGARDGRRTAGPVDLALLLHDGVAALLQQRDQAVGPDEVRRADDDEARAAGLHAGFDLRNPAAVAAHQQRLIDLGRVLHVGKREALHRRRVTGAPRRGDGLDLRLLRSADFDALAQHQVLRLRAERPSRKLICSSAVSSGSEPLVRPGSRRPESACRCRTPDRMPRRCSASVCTVIDTIHGFIGCSASMPRPIFDSHVETAAIVSLDSWLDERRPRRIHRLRKNQRGELRVRRLVHVDLFHQHVRLGERLFHRRRAADRSRESAGAASRRARPACRRAPPSR